MKAGEEKNNENRMGKFLERALKVHQMNR